MAQHPQQAAAHMAEKVIKEVFFVCYLNVEDNFSLILAKLVLGDTSVFARVGWMQISHSQCVIFDARPLVASSFFDHIGLQVTLRLLIFMWKSPVKLEVM